MKVVLFAYHEVGAAALDALIASGDDVRRRPSPIVMNPGEGKLVPIGRPESRPRTESRSTPPILRTIRSGSIESRRWLPTPSCPAHYRKMIGRDVLSICPDRCFNLHASLLPKFRGRAPINWALVEGATETGVTLSSHDRGRADAGGHRDADPASDR